MALGKIASEGLWSANPALVGMLGLCPLLAVSADLSTSIGLGIATMLVLTISNGVISSIRRLIEPNTRLPVQILVIATAVTSVDLLMQAWYFELHQRVGLFVALIVTNCVLLGRAERFASKQPVLLAMFDGLMTGLGFLFVLILMGSLREVTGQGTLLANFSLLTGMESKGWTLQFFDQGFLLMALPPGAFLCLGLLIAAKNFLDNKYRKKQKPASTARINIRLQD